MKKFATVITKIGKKGTTTFKCSTLSEAQFIAETFQHRLIDLMEFDGKNWNSLMF